MYKRQDWHPQFKFRLTQDYAGIMLPSLFSFNATAEEVEAMLLDGVSKGKQFLFCDENLVVVTADDVHKIKRYLELMQ